MCTGLSLSTGPADRCPSPFKRANIADKKKTWQDYQLNRPANGKRWKCWLRVQNSMGIHLSTAYPVPRMLQGQQASRRSARKSRGLLKALRSLQALHGCLASGTSRQSFGTMHYTVHSQPCIHIRNVRNPTMQLFLTRLTICPALGGGKG